MIFSERVTVPPTAELFDLARAKGYLRVPHNKDDLDIESFAVAAREWAENRTGRKFITQTVLVSFAELSEHTVLPFPPIQSIVSVKYFDSANSQQTIDPSNYYLTDVGLFKSLRLVSAYSMPAVFDRPDAVQVDYVVGYGSNLAAVPAPIVSAVGLYMRSLYDRTDEGVAAAENLLSQYTVNWL